MQSVAQVLLPAVKLFKREAACPVAPAKKTPPRKLNIPEWMRKWLEKFPSRNRKQSNICENHGLYTILVTCSGPEVDPIEAIWIDMVINCVAGWFPSFTVVTLSSLLKAATGIRDHTPAREKIYNYDVNYQVAQYCCQAFSDDVSSFLDLTFHQPADSRKPPRTHFFRRVIVSKCQQIISRTYRGSICFNLKIEELKEC